MQSKWHAASPLHVRLLYAAYGWLLLTGVLHFGIDVVSQYLRGRRLPGPETTLYYGLNSAYSLSQILFALMGLMAIRNAVADLGRWPGLTLGFGATFAWVGHLHSVSGVFTTSHHGGGLCSPSPRGCLYPLAVTFLKP